MKKFLHKLPIWATVFCVLFCSVLSINVQPSFAASSYWAEFQEYTSPEYPSSDGIGVFESSYDGIIYGAVATGPSVSSLSPDLPVTLPVGDYNFTGVPIPDSLTGPNPVIRGFLVTYSDGSSETYPFGYFSVTEDVVLIMVASFNKVPSVHLSSKPLYYSAFDMFADFIYGEGAELTAEQNMTLTILATLAALFVVLFPFLIVFLVVRFVIWLR